MPCNFLHIFKIKNSLISGEEKQINPFMRVSQPDVRKLSEKDNDVDTMTFVRALKDNFKPPK